MSICASSPCVCEAKPNHPPTTAGSSVFSLGLRFDTAELGRLLLFLAQWDGVAPLWFSVDRTNWEFGETDHNLLVISAHLGDTAIPLLWRALDKAGNSNTSERIALMKRLLAFFPKDRILGLLADREFIGETWLGWLQQQGIPFVTRLKGNQIARLRNGATMPLEKLFAPLREGRCSAPVPVTLGGHLRLRVQGKRTCKGLVIVAFDGALPEAAGDPANIYRRRWRIECGFACLKRKGFALEDTRLIHAERLETLMGVVAIAFAWALAIGLLAKEPTRKNHGYPANCRFTLGKHTLIHALQYTEKIANLIAYAFNVMGVNHDVV